jgi:hypothetical protein
MGIIGAWFAPLAGRNRVQLTFATQAERNTERSEVFRALETKFLRFETRQEQDTVLSGSPAPAVERDSRPRNHIQPTDSSSARDSATCGSEPQCSQSAWRCRC